MELYEGKVMNRRVQAEMQKEKQRSKEKREKLMQYSKSVVEAKQEKLVSRREERLKELEKDRKDLQASMSKPLLAPPEYKMDPKREEFLTNMGYKIKEEGDQRARDIDQRIELYEREMERKTNQELQAKQDRRKREVEKHLQALDIQMKEKEKARLEKLELDRFYANQVLENDRRDREKMAKDKHDAMEYERQFQRMVTVQMLEDKKRKEDAELMSPQEYSMNKGLLKEHGILNG